jgi:LacI family transcriptional regulator
MNKGLPSIRSVAQRAGVSTATVSNVLNARRSVAPELVARVRDAVAELGYIADLGAARLRSRRSCIAGLVVPDIANPFFGTLAAVVEDAARRDGYDLLIVSTEDDPAEEATRLRTLLTWRPAGIIVVAAGESLPLRAQAEAAGVALVAADRIPAGPPLDVVAVDNRTASAAVLRHLLAGGRRHILLVAARRAISNVAERLAAAQAEADAAGAVLEVIEVGFTLADSRTRLARRLVAGPAPDALFTLNNVATLAALETLNEAGLRVPEDVALVGFDDPDWARIAAPPVTTVSQPVAALGRAAWAQLAARIGGDTAPPRELRLGCTLEIRGSSAPRAPFLPGAGSFAALAGHGGPPGHNGREGARP